MTRWDSSLTAAALDDLITVVRQRRPEVDDTPPELIGEGISTLTYGLSSPGQEWALRVSRRHPQPWTWRGGRAHEVALLTELKRRGLPVPEGATVIEEQDGLPSAILEHRVVGARLDPDLVRHDPAMPTKIASVLDRLHSIDLDHPIVQQVPRDDPTGEFRQALVDVDLDDDHLRQRVVSALEVLESRTSIRTLCHRDFRLDHLIFDADGELAGLLDLGEIGVDDPAVDLAFLHGELGGHFVAEVCAAMDTADPDLAVAARVLHSLWPLLELAPGGDSWGDPATARDRLDASV